MDGWKYNCKQSIMDIADMKYYLSQIKSKLEKEGNGLSDVELQRYSEALRGVRGIILGCKRIIGAFDDE